MTLQARADLAQGGKFFHGEEAAQCQGAVQAGGSMALAQHKAVTILPLGVLRVDLHALKVQIGEQVSSGKASAGVAAVAGVNGDQRIAAQITGFDLKLQLFFFSHGDLLSSMISGPCPEPPL